MKYFVKNLKNNFDFFLREHLAFSRKNYFIQNEPKEGLFADNKLIEREKTLVEKYSIEHLKSNSTTQNYCENLYTLDILDRYFTINFQENLRALDIGSKNWFYVQGEYFFFKKHSKNLKLTGIELDANRLYTNLYTRKELAKFYTQGLEECEYIHSDFLKHNSKYNCIIWFLPFVVDYPLLKWGLPSKYFQPKDMLKHAYESLEPGGMIFVVNQGEMEYNIQNQLCNALKINFQPLGKIESDFLKYEIDRYAILISKD